MKNSSSFFCNKECEYFPCHKVSEDKLDDFNCLLCYCPLSPYENCGGNYTILKNGWKDCSQCLLPHYNFKYIINKMIDLHSQKCYNDSTTGKELDERECD